MTKSYALTLLVVLSATSFLSADELKTVSDKPAEAELGLKQSLEWLPPGTETIIAAQGPFQIPVIDPNRDKPTLTELAEFWAFEPLRAVREGKYLKALEGQTLLLSLEGARHFRSPIRLGLCPYDGCQILIFDDKFLDVGAKLMTSLRAGANRTHEREQQDLLAFDETREKDRWTIFVARPRPNILLCGTDRQFVTAVLELMESPKRRPDTPKLSDLPEWKHVDTKARFWAIRHFDAGNAPNDPTSPLTTKRRAANNPDPQAIGLTYSFDPTKEPQTAIVNYLTTNPDRERVLKPFWYREKGGWVSTVTHDGTDATEMRFPVRDGRVGDDFDFQLLMVLGHAIYI
jgi:hypothetical protein